MQRAAQALSEDSLTEQLVAQRKNIHGGLIDLAEKLNVRLDDSLSSLSKTSTDSSEFVVSPESSSLVRYLSSIHFSHNLCLRYRLFFQNKLI